jgi:hypothetical protein
MKQKDLPGPENLEGLSFFAYFLLTAPLTFRVNRHILEVELRTWIAMSGLSARAERALVSFAIVKH